MRRWLADVIRAAANRIDPPKTWKFEALAGNLGFTDEEIAALKRKAA